MRRTLVRTLTGVAVAAALIGTAACAPADKSDDTGSGGCTYKIAMMGPITGPNAGLGKPILESVKLAVDQHNKKDAAHCVTLVESDDKGDEAVAPGLAQQLVQDQKVLGVVGPAFSGPTKASGQIFEDGALPIISASATRPDLADNGWKTFHRSLGNDASQGPAVGKFIKDTLKAAKVFLIDDKSEYGTGLADQAATALGSAVVDRQSIQPKQTDFSAIASAVNAAKPDVVFFAGYYAEGGPLAKALKTAGVTATFVGPDGIKDQGFIDGAADAADGSIITCPCVPAEKATGTFAADYKAMFGADAGTYGAEAYDAATVFLTGISAGVDSRAKMLEHVNAYDAPGVSKHIKFDDKGEIDKSVIVIWTYDVVDGKIVAREPIQ
ncbi:branched-chain amino acid ABC transporter substrate-binding protein [Phytomonospora endophytica]|uniref:Branched-chain amino acid transport system substrate-binding protein n=1 Tax=Phytomonospora endophytica TaxID=714109 RepID=A0A841FEG4_9ACTN|nr:branched-chain amino acid ABC transporter substrate-binding protein [Phytomonospora endophytica]MBB6035681.1 branched-chain amino acid transport system substrate-binding protein [Phytomonospora endophytica]GIG69642.1 branched chain amino acid ABC transporter substrate-binding protein [Phytomonospora endophytica]